MRRMKMTEDQVTKFMDEILRLVDRKIDERLNNYARILPATVTAISPDNLRVSVRMLGSDEILENIENYDTRTVSVGDNVHLICFGITHRLNNVALLLGGDAFRN
jgi:hypothetical protein